MIHNTVDEKAATEKFEKTLLSMANALIEELRDLPVPKRLEIIKRKIADSDVVMAMAQLQHNMWVTAARTGVLSIITAGGKWVEMTIPADPLYQHLLHC